MATPDRKLILKPLQGEPTVSVIMSVFNGARYLRAAVESILNQTYRNLEFIVVDDASTDESAAILSGFSDARLVVLTNAQNLGLTASLNRALREARGALIARQDADDISHPARLARQVDFLKKNVDVGLLGTGFDLIDLDGSPRGTHRPATNDIAIGWAMLFNNAFCHTSIMLRRELLPDDAALYDTSLRYAQDFEAWSRLLRHTGGANIAQPLVSYRAHDANISAQFGGDQQAVADRVAAANIGAISQWKPDDPGQLRRLRVLNGAGSAALIVEPNERDLAAYFQLLRDYMRGVNGSRLALAHLAWAEIRKFANPRRIGQLPPRLRRAIARESLRTIGGLIPGRG